MLDALVSAAVIGRQPEDIAGFWVSQPVCQAERPMPGATDPLAALNG